MKISRASIFASTWIALVTSLAACGGGSGDNTGPAPAPAAKAPILQLSVSSPKVKQGDSATLSWTSSNTTSCSASGGWRGTKATSGSQVITPEAGQATYELTCVGAGGSASQQTLIIVPFPVLRSSYENKMAAYAALGAHPDTPWGIGDAVAEGDFFQEGQYTFVGNSLLYSTTDPAKQNLKGRIYFFRLVNGVWVDETSKLLDDTEGCLHPRKALVADFNGDGKPDVFFGCHGFDASPYPGEPQVYLLSQSNGRYKKFLTAESCYCHGSAAADFSGNGFADVLVTDQSIHPQPYFLINQSNGTFASDLTRLPSTIARKQLITAELVDTRGIGRYDAILAGSNPLPESTVPNGNVPPTIFLNDGSKSFKSSSITLPVYPSSVGGPVDLSLDFVFNAGYVYMLRTACPLASANCNELIQRTNLSTLNSSEVYTHTGAYAGAGNTWWFRWMAMYQNQMISTRKVFGVSVPLTP